MWWTVFVTAVLCLLTSTKSKEITVCSSTGNNGSCVQVGEALTDISSDTIVNFNPGAHVVEAFVFLTDLRNVSFVGLEEVTVTCKEGIGLAFFNISNLLLENISIRRCGLNGANWDPIINVLNDTVEMFAEIPSITKVALLIGSCDNVTLTNVSIMETSGIGLLGINVVGSSTLNRVVFRQNQQPVCVTGSLIPLEGNEQWIGGGAYFLYQDYGETDRIANVGHKLTILSSEFVNNSDCGISGAAGLYIEYSTALRDHGYHIGAGGGLSVMMAQVHYAVNVSVVSTTFVKNRAKFGGGAHVGLFSGVTCSHLLFLNCSFDENSNQESFSGGGIIVFVDLIRPQQLQGSFQLPDIRERDVSLRVVDSTFTKNVAIIGGAVFVYSLYAEDVIDSSIRISFSGCTFAFNEALGGSAAIFYEKKNNGLDPGLQVEVSDTKFVNNSIRLTAAEQEQSTYTYTGGTVHVFFLNLTISGDSLFADNLGTGLVGVRGSINVKGNAVFSSNQGTYGGAMHLIDYTFLTIFRNTTISFIDNTASVVGGAIYVDLLMGEFSFDYEDCFLHFESVDLFHCNLASCPRIRDLAVFINFTGNTAPQGSFIYGATLETCPWVTALRISDVSYNNSMTLYQNLDQNYQSVVVFDPKPVGQRAFSTPSTVIEASVGTPPPVVVPGQKFSVSLSALDRFSQQVPDTVISRVRRERGRRSNFVSQLGDSGSWFLDGSGNNANTPLTVVGGQNRTVQVSLFSALSGASTQISVTLVTCPTGFIYDKATMGCVCEPELESRGVTCDVSQQQFIVPDGAWIGVVVDSETGDQRLVVSDFCPFDYCTPEEKTVGVGDYSSQCHDGFHRTGLLCGSCEDGYSIQFGSFRCGKCSNYYLFLLLFFVTAGLFLVFALGFLHISIAEGYLNAVLFYANIVNLFAVNLSPATHIIGPFTPAALLSLNFGIESCFYDGMDALARVGFQLAFIAYLFILVGTITLAARYVKLSGTHMYSPAKVFATLLLLCYVSVLQACVSILTFAEVQTLDGATLLRWYIDPTVSYFSGVHGFLGSLSIVIILLYIIPLPIFALFPSKVYRLKYTMKFKPLYDALWAPFNCQFRSWLGVRLILRWIIFSFAGFVSFPHSLFAVGLLLSLILYIQTKLQPFKGFWRNVVDDALVTNLILLVIGALYFNNFDNSSHPTIYSSVLAFVAYIIFVGVFIRHLYLRFRCFRQCVQRVMDKIQTRPAADPSVNMVAIRNPSITVTKAGPGDSASDDPPDQSISASDSTHHELRVWQNQSYETDSTGELSSAGLPRVISFTELREPLLDEGELEVSTVSKTLSITSRPRTPTPMTMSSRSRHTANTDRYSN